MVCLNNEVENENRHQIAISVPIHLFILASPSSQINWLNEADLASQQRQFNEII